MTQNSNLTEQSFYGYAIIKSATAKMGIGGGASVIDWVTGPAAGLEISSIGWETGAAFGTSATHGIIWRR